MSCTHFQGSGGYGVVYYGVYENEAKECLPSAIKVPLPVALHVFDGQEGFSFLRGSGACMPGSQADRTGNPSGDFQQRL